MASNDFVISPYIVAGLKRQGMPKSLVKITPQEWINSVCIYFECDFDYLKAKNRKQERIYPRQMLCYLLYTNTTLSLNQLAVMFGQHHSTIIASRESISDQISIKNQQVINDIEQVTEIAKYQ